MTDLQRIPLETIDHQATSLAAYSGKVLLIVNTASKCGLTPQYAGLETLYTRYRNDGLVVLGFPSNDFAGQEPGSDTDIASFCSSNYAVDFPLFSKVKVVGAQKHPLYAALIAQQPKAADSESFRAKLKGYNVTPNPEPEVLWNFEKFLIAKDGRTVARFSPDIAPDDARVVEAIENALQA
ncbi:MAG TPA: glutathione peroxidase [Steroidobacteraceae bacterium]|jgi:glutathione peroxidase|nr:glutathione peroxidase [Steroidobacteraceae bacterium]